MVDLCVPASPWADALGDWLTRTFPSPLPVPTSECIHTTVLSSLAGYIYFSNAQPASGHDQASLQRDMNYALNAPRAVEKLGAMRFEGERDSNAEEGGCKGKSAIRRKPNQLERRKQLHAEARKLKLTRSEEEVEILRGLGGLSVPDNPQEAQALASALTIELKNLLVVSASRVAQCFRY
jgi:hypothetical protein